MHFFRKTVATFALISLLFSISCSAVEPAMTDEASVIILDAGHGGEDSGAVGVNGVLEKELNLAIAVMIGEELTARGYTVVQTRTEDRLLYTEAENIKGIRKISDLKNRVKIFNSYENAIVVSIHMNSFAIAKYSGLQVYYADGSDSLATAIKSAVREELQPENKRAIKRGEGIYVLEHSENTAVLIECGFLSNPEECAKLSEKEYQKRLSFSIVCGIIKYMEEKTNEKEA